MTVKKSRTLTLDPVLERDMLPIQPVRVESSMPAGFRVEWLTAEDDNLDIGLTAGAGCGSPYMVLTVKDKKTGDSIEEVVDMRPVVEAWVDAALAAGPTPERSES